MARTTTIIALVQTLVVKGLLIFGGIIVLVFVGGSLFLWLAFANPCANDNIVETVSPNGQLKAVTFRRDCGATTSFSTHVSILPVSRKLPNEAGNVFTANHEPSITVHWIDDRHLSITGHTQNQFRHLTEFRGVSIYYQ